MDLYSRWILPRLLDLSMRNRLLDHYRQRAIEAARGLVLEVGVGSGLNLPFYSQAVDRVCGIDLSLELLRLAHRRTVDALIPVSLLRASAEHLPFADAVFDTVVMTCTLCSIANPVAALIEMRGVLKPGAWLVFVEHGLSPETRIARWQHWLTPCWKRIGGGCHLDRKADDLIRAAVFRIKAMETGYMKGPKPWTFMYRAVRPSSSYRDSFVLPRLAPLFRSSSARTAPPRMQARSGCLHRTRGAKGYVRRSRSRSRPPPRPPFIPSTEIGCSPRL